MVTPRQAKVVEFRHFGGLTGAEIVAALNISPRTVRRDWDLAAGLFSLDRFPEAWSYLMTCVPGVLGDLERR